MWQVDNQQDFLNVFLVLLLPCLSLQLVVLASCDFFFKLRSSIQEEQCLCSNSIWWSTNVTYQISKWLCTFFSYEGSNSCWRSSDFSCFQVDADYPVMLAGIATLYKANIICLLVITILLLVAFSVFFLVLVVYVCYTPIPTLQLVSWVSIRASVARWSWEMHIGRALESSSY